MFSSWRRHYLNKEFLAIYHKGLDFFAVKKISNILDILLFHTGVENLHLKLQWAKKKKKKAEKTPKNLQTLKNPLTLDLEKYQLKFLLCLIQPGT